MQGTAGVNMHIVRSNIMNFLDNPGPRLFLFYPLDMRKHVWFSRGADPQNPHIKYTVLQNLFK